MKKSLIILGILIVAIIVVLVYNRFSFKELQIQGFDSEAECTQNTGQKCQFQCGGAIANNDSTGMTSGSCNFAKWIPTIN